MTTIIIHFNHITKIPTITTPNNSYNSKLFCRKSTGKPNWQSSSARSAKAWTTTRQRIASSATRSPRICRLATGRRASATAVSFFSARPWTTFAHWARPWWRRNPSPILITSAWRRGWTVSWSRTATRPSSSSRRTISLHICHSEFISGWTFVGGNGKFSLLLKIYVINNI